MTLRWPAFENRIRRLLRVELAGNPDLRKQVRNARKPRPATNEQFRLRLLFCLLAAVVFVGFSNKIRNVEFALAIISLWSAGAVFRKAQLWFQTFYASEDLVALNLLPLSDEQIFRIQSRKFALQFGWIFLELTLLYLAVGLVPQPSNLLLLAPVIALFQTALIFSLSLHAVVFLFALPLGAIASVLRASAILFLFFGPHIQSFVPYLVQFSYWFFPTGWVNYALMQSLFREDWITTLLLFPLAAIVYAGIYSWHRLRAFYNLEGLELMPHPAMLGDAAQVTSRGATEIQDTIGEGAFLRSLDWPESGRLEKWISKSLPARDRMVLEFLVAEDPGWTRSFRNALWTFGFGALIVYLFGQYGGLVVFVPAYLIALAAVPLFGGEWRGLQVLPSTGVMLPLHALYPVSLKEMTRVMLRVNIFRTIVAAPLLLAFGLLAAWKLGDPLLMGWKLTCKILGLFLALQPLLVLLPISKSANYNASRSWLHLIANITMLLAVMLLSIAFFFAPKPLHTFFLLVSVFGISLLLHGLYRRAFNRGRLDLLHARAAASGA